jgi:hypothetical protein
MLDGQSVRWRRSLGLAVVVLLGLSSGVRAGDETGSIFNAAKTAVENGKVEKTRMQGWGNDRTAFTESPSEGAILIGFDVGVRREGTHPDVIFAIRPVYMTEHGETVGNSYGLFADKYLTPKKVLKSRVTNTIHVRAKDGYAVGAVTLRTGITIDGMRLTFMRINGRTLDPNKSYHSDWIGDRAADREQPLTGNGSPIVGMFGNQDDERVMAFGLIFIGQPAKPADPPRVEKPVRPPVEKAAPRLADPPVEELPRKDAEGPALLDPPSPRKQFVEVNDPFGPDVVKPKEEGGMSLLPFVIFGIVTVVFGGGLLLVFGLGGRSKHNQTRNGRTSRPQAAKAAALEDDYDYDVVEAVEDEVEGRLPVPPSTRKSGASAVNRPPPLSGNEMATSLPVKKKQVNP